MLSPIFKTFGTIRAIALSFRFALRTRLMRGFARRVRVLGRARLRLEQLKGDDISRLYTDGIGLGLNTALLVLVLISARESTGAGALRLVG